MAELPQPESFSTQIGRAIINTGRTIVKGGKLPYVGTPDGYRILRRQIRHTIGKASKEGTLTFEGAELALTERNRAMLRSGTNILRCFYLDALAILGLDLGLANYAFDTVLRKHFKIDSYPDVGNWTRGVKLTSGVPGAATAVFSALAGPLSWASTCFLYPSALVATNIDTGRQLLPDIHSIVNGFRAAEALEKRQVQDFNKNKTEIVDAMEIFGARSRETDINKLTNKPILLDASTPLSAPLQGPKPKVMGNGQKV